MYLNLRTKKETDMDGKSLIYTDRRTCIYKRCSQSVIRANYGEKFRHQEQKKKRSTEWCTFTKVNQGVQ